jgi:hypothetical protein
MKKNTNENYFLSEISLFLFFPLHLSFSLSPSPSLPPSFFLYFYQDNLRVKPQKSLNILIAGLPNVGLVLSFLLFSSLLFSSLLFNSLSFIFHLFFIYFSFIFHLFFIISFTHFINAKSHIGKSTIINSIHSLTTKGRGKQKAEVGARPGVTRRVSSAMKVRLPFHTQHTTHNNTQQHTTTHNNTQQHTTTHNNTQQHTTTHNNTQQHTTTHNNTQQHTTTHNNTTQHNTTTQHTTTHNNTQHTTHNTQHTTHNTQHTTKHYFRSRIPR